MATPFPRSGELLRLLAPVAREVLPVGSHARRALDPHSGTRQRFARGQGGHETRRDHRRHLATGLVVMLEPIFRRLLGSALEQPRGRRIIERNVAVDLKLRAARWDYLAAALNRRPPASAPEAPARASCLRMVVVDLALRISAVLWLMNWPPLPAAWFEDHGPGLLLRSFAGRDAIARSCKAKTATVDGWLYRRAVPRDRHLRALATLLSASGVGDAADVLCWLRVGYFARRLQRAVKRHLGQRPAEELSGRLVAYTNRLLEARRSTAPTVTIERACDDELGGAIDDACCAIEDGATEPSTGLPLGVLVAAETCPFWRWTIERAPLPWFVQLAEPPACDPLRAALAREPTASERSEFDYYATEKAWRSPT